MAQFLSEYSTPVGAPRVNLKTSWESIVLTILHTKPREERQEKRKSLCKPSQSASQSCTTHVPW